MDSVNVKEARRRFAKLVSAAQQGRSVAITRRGRPVAEIAPIAAKTPKTLPDLTAFRAGLGKPRPKSQATIRALREQARF
jgi:prevent-host-death family protein